MFAGGGIALEVHWNVQVFALPVTGKLNVPLAVGVPAPTKITFCGPVVVNVPDAEKLIPFTIVVEME